MKELTWVKEKDISVLCYRAYTKKCVYTCCRARVKGWNLLVKKEGKLRLLSNHETLKLAKEAATK